MCSDDEIVSVNGEIAHRGMWQIELQRLPVVTVIKGNEYRALRTCKEQPLAFGIFAHRVARSTGRNAVRYFAPRLAEVASPIDVRAQIVQAKAVNGSICRTGLEMRNLDDRDLAPGLELRWRDVLPGLSGVLRDVNQTVVRARPNCIRVLERRRDRVNHAPVLALLRIVGRKSPEVWRRIVGSPRKIGTDHLPAISGIDGFEKDVGREI